MLTVAKVTQGSAAGYAEYLEGKAQAAELGDYYLKDGERVEAPGRWAAGAHLVGAGGELPVSGEQLRELMAVRRPDTGEPLRRAGASGEAVAAIDATFSAPKSVSAIWAVADPGLRTSIERAHEQAIDRALDYSLRHVAMIRHRVEGGTVIHAKAAGLIATSWRHTTARAVDGHPPDPQLHSHLVLHAAVRRDGRIVAIDSRSWLVHRRELGASYRSELARALVGLGFGIRRQTGRGERYFEIEGVPGSLVAHWSSRHQQVQIAIRRRLGEQERTLEAAIARGGPNGPDAAERLELLRRSGLLAPREERFMATLTRSAKTPLTHADLDEHWQRAGAEHALDARALDQLRTRRRPLAPAPRQQLLVGLTEFDATFPARDARAVALERSAGAEIEDAVELLRELRDAGEILVLADGTGTTREHRGRERATVALAERLARQAVPPIPPALVALETARLDRELALTGGALSGEQHRAIELACGTHQLVVIEGQAGTGKSTTLSGIARAHQAAGRQIVVTSTAALAAERLANELAGADVGASSYSTAGLHAAIQTGYVVLGPETTVIHDEAALASTTEQARLLDAIETSGGRLIEVGDPAQSQPVGAGGLWSHLERATRQAGAHVGLARNQRARNPDDRRDQALFRAGEHERAIRGYAARDHVHITAGPSQAEDLALDAAQADREAGKTTIVIAQTSNEHLDELNARAQALREQHSELGRESVTVPGRPYKLHAGDQLQVRRTLNHPDYGRIPNGRMALVADVDPKAHRLVIRLRDGDEIALDESQIARADLRLAYVQHPFPAQGQTTDTAHVIVSDNTTAEGSYVAITRARDRTDIYAGIDPAERSTGRDRLQVVAERMSRTEPEVPSIDVPLQHEIAVTIDPEQHDSMDPRSVADSSEPTIIELVEPAVDLTPPWPALETDRTHERDLDLDGVIAEDRPEPWEAAESDGRERRWPRSRQPDVGREALETDHQVEATERMHGWGREP